MPEEIEITGLPDIKIIKDGKAVDISAIDDYSFMTFLMQASIAAATTKIKKYYEDRTSKGQVLNFPLTITPTSQEVLCSQLCQTLYLENGGPGQIFLTINSLAGTPTPIPTTRAVYFDFETHKIQRFYVWSAPGTAATATAVLTY